MRRSELFLTVLLILAIQVSGRAQTMKRLVFTYAGQSFAGKVLGHGPVNADSRITMSLTLDVPSLIVNVSSREHLGGATATGQGEEPAIISPSNRNVYVREWKMSDGVHNANKQNAVLDIRSFKADVTPDGQIHTISWGIFARSFKPEKQFDHPGDPPTFSLRTGWGFNDKSTSNYPNGGNVALGVGPALRSGKWSVTITATNTPITSSGPPIVRSTAPAQTGSQQFRTIPAGSRFVFNGTRVFIRDSSGNLTVAPDGKYRPFNNNYIMTVRGGEKFTY